MREFVLIAAAEATFNKGGSDGAPGLRGRAATLDHVPGDCRLSHLKAQFQQLATDARRTPQGVLGTHLPDQGTKLVFDPGSADMAA